MKNSQGISNPVDGMMCFVLKERKINEAKTRKHPNMVNEFSVSLKERRIIPEAIVNHSKYSRNLIVEGAV
jgi:hypothetical protein